MSDRPFVVVVFGSEGPTRALARYVSMWQRARPDEPLPDCFVVVGDQHLEEFLSGWFGDGECRSRAATSSRARKRGGGCAHGKGDLRTAGR